MSITMDMSALIASSFVSTGAIIGQSQQDLL